MQERLKIHHVPVKVYRSDERLVVAAPMPGMEPEDIHIELQEDGRLILHGDVRALLKEVKELLIDEWSIGAYHRELQLTQPVDGERANVTYGNGVLVVALPLSTAMRPAHLTLAAHGQAHGLHQGGAGRPSAWT
ncbi:Hsp20/alpha crystallin family protein [Thermogemmatispora onikobensis]|uniref:Hsp20/alpha crystallin family protein n=1 Tax=Thermogemmatispora onikobensis TaxID=732234 RepID=UPI00085383A0|nr:Hsp20/alpha crystallin family protein [Thermogemmatispora onikobensis]